LSIIVALVLAAGCSPKDSESQHDAVPELSPLNDAAGNLDQRGTGDAIVPTDVEGEADLALPADLPGPQETPREADGALEPADLAHADAQLEWAGPGDGETSQEAQADALTAGIAVAVVSPAAWQRGPVVIDYFVEGSQGTHWTPEVFWKGTESDLEPCASMEGYGEGLKTQTGDGKHRFVWDSMADVPAVLGPVWVTVRVLPEGGTYVSATTEEFGLRNEPDAARQVLVTSSINGNDKVRRFLWTHEQGMSKEEQLLVVKDYPVRVAMAPSGYFAALLEEGSESISLLKLDAQTGVASVAGSIPFPDLYPVDLVYAGDGASLFVACASPDPDGGAYRVDLDPATGLPAVGSLPKQLSSQFQVAAVELLRDGQGIVVLGPDPGMNAAGLHLETISLSGVLLDQADLVNDGALPRSVSVSPEGSLMLVAWANFFGGVEGVALFGLSAGGTMTYLDEVTAEDPEEALFGGSGDRGIVTEAFGNKVTGLAITPSSLERSNSVKMGLPTRAARTAWGPDSDTFLAATVSATTGESSLAAVSVGPTGALLPATYYVMGDGNDVIPQDVAIQP
jgi:hypothetical protein